MKKIVRLVPEANGGIGRLFSYLGASGEAARRYTVTTFVTHGSWSKSAIALPLRLSRFAALCRNGEADLVHINLASRGSTYRKLIYASLCRRYRVPYLVHLHGGGFRDFYAGCGTGLRRRIDEMFSGAALVITTGTAWRRYVMETFSLREDHVVALANGVPGPDEVDWGRKEMPPRILFLGLLHADKGVPELIEALSSPKLRNMAWSATLAGGGDVETYRAHIAKRGLSDRVTLPGWIGASDVRDLLERSSVLVLPSHVENMPLSLLEGMAYGLCCVSTPVGSIGEVIENGVNGLLVPPGRTSTLEAALRHVMEDGALRAQLASNARASYEARFTLARMQQGLEGIYDMALSERRGMETQTAVMPRHSVA